MLPRGMLSGRGDLRLCGSLAQGEHARARAVVGGGEIVEQARQLEGSAELRGHDLGPDPAAAHEQALAHELLDGLAHRRPAQSEPFGEVGLGVDAVAGAQPAVADGVLELLGELEVQGHAAAAIEGQVQRHGPRLGRSPDFVKTY